MRIAIISDFGHVSGGAAKVAIDSARGLAEHGHKVVFLYAIAPADGALAHPNIETVHLPFADVWSLGKIAGARQGVWNAEAARLVGQVLAERRADLDLVHLHQWTKAFSPASIAAAGASGLPVFVTIHDYFSFCPQGNYFNVPAAKRCDLAPMSAACIASNCDRDSYLHKLVRVGRTLATTRAFARCPDLTFVHVTSFARRFAEPHLPAHARHATVENMVEIVKRPPVDVAKNRHVLFLGRFVAEKGPHILAAAAKAAGISVRFVGDGPMKEAIGAANSEAMITGWVAAEKVFDEIAQARAMVLPSLWFEPGPLVVAEAMSCGVPMILARTTGPASWILHGKNGLIVEPNDEAGLTDALRRIAKDADAAALGSGAYDSYWRDPFNLKRHVGRLTKAYTQAETSALAAA